MRLSELLREDLIKIRLEAVTKWEAIEELVDQLIATHEIRLADREEVVEAVFERERSLTTGLEHGLAVPHGTAGCVEEIVAAMGTAPDGIPFESLDGQPARLVVLLVIPTHTFQNHVRTLAGIAALGLNADLREALFYAETPADAMNIIYQADEVHGAEGA